MENGVIPMQGILEMPTLGNAIQMMWPYLADFGREQAPGPGVLPSGGELSLAHVSGAVYLLVPFYVSRRVQAGMEQKKAKQERLG